MHIMDPSPRPNPGTHQSSPHRTPRSEAEPTEEEAFFSGAALARLDLALAGPDLPLTLLRDRLALHAAEATLELAGRPERATDLRDAVHLLRPGDQPGPAGAVYQTWQRAVERPLSTRTLQRALPNLPKPRIKQGLTAGQGTAIRQSSAVLETVLGDFPHAETEALILAEAALSRACGWDHVLPILTGGLTSRDLRRTGPGLRAACHRAVSRASPAILRLIGDVTRRAAQLQALTPGLRAKGAADAVAMFLTCDALTPGALVPNMSDRAARRLCDRLVELGGVRELTGRPTFRIYGI